MYCTHYLGTGTGNHCYRPQTKFAKVMFSQVSVCPQGGGHAGCSWQGACVVGGVAGGGGVAGEMATVVGGMHTTGMHSCFLLCPSRSLSLFLSRSRAVCMSR